MNARLFLIRHARAAQPDGVPEPEWPLTPEGVAQAEALAGLLAIHGVRHLYASPFTRARGTLAPYAEGSGLTVQIHEGLSERRLAGDLIADFITALRTSFVDPDHCLPGGESHRACTDRVRAAITDIAAAHPDEPVAICSHGVAITSYLGSLDPAIGFDFWRALRNPHLFAVDTSASLWRDLSGN